MALGLCVKLQTLWSSVRARLEDDSGAVATEYIFLLVLIALAITGGLVFFATQLNAKFSGAATCLGGAPTC